MFLLNFNLLKTMCSRGNGVSKNKGLPQPQPWLRKRSGAGPRLLRQSCTPAQSEKAKGMYHTTKRLEEYFPSVLCPFAEGHRELTLLEPAGEGNNALNQANTNLFFPRYDGAHSGGFAARLHSSCSRRSWTLPCLRAGPGGMKPPRARLPSTPEP